ncbi:MAG TPA: site-specific integrase, partial [Chromatiaceae bacterium]|nr:site-specific integrase [Chromatiaceae bacterium]
MDIAKQIASIKFDRKKVTPESALDEYLAGLAKSSRRSRLFALKTVAKYFASRGVDVSAEELSHNFDIWVHLDSAFVLALYEWMMENGYSVNSAQVVKSFIFAQLKLLQQCGMITRDKLGSIYILTKTGRLSDGKKPKWYGRKSILSDEQAHRLKNDHDTNTVRGRRDKALMHILLDHGLRRSEVVGLDIDNIDMTKGVMTFYRSKTDTWTTVKLTVATFTAIKEHIEKDGIQQGTLIQSVNKGDNIEGPIKSGVAINNIVKRVVRNLFKDEIDISAHDCRHYWATKRAEEGATALQLMKEGSWSS